ncbi:MAG: 4Fe-4S dicluster domain-containing protein [Anaerolineales bacterium]
MALIVAAHIVCLDEELCDGCRICLPACNFKGLLSIPGERMPMVDLWSCTGCGTCVTTCPQGALTLHCKEER